MSNLTRDSKIILMLYPFCGHVFNVIIQSIMKIRMSQLWLFYVRRMSEYKKGSYWFSILTLNKTHTSYVNIFDKDKTKICLVSLKYYSTKLSHNK